MIGIPREATGASRRRRGWQVRSERRRPYAQSGSPESSQTFPELVRQIPVMVP